MKCDWLIRSDVTEMDILLEFSLHGCYFQCNQVTAGNTFNCKGPKGVFLTL